MSSDILLQFCVAGVTYGIIYGVVAIGFTIIYNTTGIINFAQGEFLMIGGMTAVTLHRYTPLPVAILGAVAITILVGAAIEVLFIRWLHRPSVLRMIIITIGVSIVIREVALHIWKRHAEIHGNPKLWKSFGKTKPKDWKDLQVKGAKRGLAISHAGVGSHVTATILEHPDHQLKGGK